MKAFRYAVILGLICVAAALGLSGTYRATKPHIDKKAAEDRKAAREKVVPPNGDSEMSFEMLNPDAPELYQVAKATAGDGSVLGYAALGESQGYGGKIRVMVGMDAAAERITAVTVVAHSETPGLGSRVADVESKKTWARILAGKADDVEEETSSEFLKQFRNLTPDKLVVGKGVDGISGATISSKGVTFATRNAAAKILLLVRPDSGLAKEFAADVVTAATPEGYRHDAWKKEDPDEEQARP